MNETNELQPAPEVEATAAAVQTEPAPAQETPAEETVATSDTDITAEAEAPAQPQYETKEQVVERAQAIDAEGQGGDKSELDYLKQVFYRLHRAAQLAARNAFIEAGGAPEEWRPEIDAAEENFKSARKPRTSTASLPSSSASRSSQHRPKKPTSISTNSSSSRLHGKT